MHQRPAFGLSLCYEGEIRYTMNEKTFVSHPGVAVLLPRDASYTLHGVREGVFPVINFQGEGFDLGEIGVFPLSSPAACLKDCEHLRELLLFRASPWKILSIFYELLDRVLSSERELPLSPMIRFVEEHLSDPALSNTLLAQEAGISEITLRKRFLESFQTTPKQYILELRLRKAKQLLLDTTLSVGEIAQACGFSGVYHFCRIFKEKTGTTPTEFARIHRIRLI